MRFVFATLFLITLTALTTLTGTASAKVMWSPYKGSIPVKAVAAGTDPQNAQYICRTKYQRSIKIGRIAGQLCKFGHAGRERSAKKFSILTFARRPNYNWINAVGSDGPANQIVPANRSQKGGVTLQKPENAITRSDWYAFIGGYDLENQPIGICFADLGKRRGELPGQIKGGNCHASDGGKEIIVKSEFQLLVTQGQAE